eukprot:346491-Prymnesium_polylepis.1
MHEYARYTRHATEARRATRAERGRRAAVWRGRQPAVGVPRSERVRAAGAQREGSEEAESGEEAKEK